MNIISSAKQDAMNIAENQMNNFIIYGASKIKDTLGISFIFDSKNDYSIIDAITSKFLFKYDKGFDSHTTIIDRNKKYIDRECLIPVHNGSILNIPDTYIYLCTGRALNKNIKNIIVTDANEYNSYSNQNMMLYIFGKKYSEYVEELNDIINSVTSRDTLGLYDVSASDSHNDMNVNYSPLKPRMFNTLYFSNDEINKIKSFLDHFVDLKDFYYQKQLLYKTGILLYGKPGTGKTSLVKAIATHYNRSIININIATFDELSISTLTQSINVDSYKYIVLLEDIDTLFLNRDDDNNTREDRTIINKLLQFLDSNSSPNDVIFIATTNHKERLDEALLRNGRFDLHINVDEIFEDEVYKFGEDFGLTKENISDVIEQYKTDKSDIFDGKHFNQSSIQTYFLNKLDNKNRSTEIIDTAEVIAEQLKKKDSGEDDNEEEEY